jgi:hypothetical protein
MKLEFFVLILLIGIFGLANAGVQSDTSETVTAVADTVEEERPDFTGVDVIVETEWSEPEKNINVDVFVHLKDEHPNIVMQEVNHKLCKVRILKGVVVKIFDHKTGKLLKTYKKED